MFIHMYSATIYMSVHMYYMGTHMYNIHGYANVCMRCIQCIYVYAYVLCNDIYECEYVLYEYAYVQYTWVRKFIHTYADVLCAYAYIYTCAYPCILYICTLTQYTCILIYIITYAHAYVLWGGFGLVGSIKL